MSFAMDAAGRIGIVSHTFPPMLNGQATMTGRVLSTLPADSYVLMNSRPCDETRSHERLPALMVGLRPRISAPTIPGFGRWIVPANFAWQLHGRARQIIRIARKERCSVLLACTGDQFDLPATYLAAQHLRVPFVPYFFDWYSWQFEVARSHPDGFGEYVVNFVRAWETRLIRDAAGIIVPNEFLQQALRDQYTVEPTVIRNPTSLEDISEETPLKWPASGPTIRIVYTGAVYEAHFDAFRCLLAALTALGPVWKLHVYTDQPVEYIRRGGLVGPIEIHRQVPPLQVRRIQREADILFLPLAFFSPYPEIIRTSAPGKIGDYLACGRPILVHAPPDSYVASYFRRHQCGLVADQPDSAAVAEVLRGLATNADLRAHICRQASCRVREDFSLAQAHDGLLSVLHRVCRR